LSAMIYVVMSLGEVEPWSVGTAITLPKIYTIARSVKSDGGARRQRMTMRSVVLLDV